MQLSTEVSIRMKLFHLLSTLESKSPAAATAKQNVLSLAYLPLYNYFPSLLLSLHSLGVNQHFYPCLGYCCFLINQSKIQWCKIITLICSQILFGNSGYGRDVLLLLQDVCSLSWKDTAAGEL